MTAPGNTALVVSLIAVFVACAAYAIGRLHQRGRDREDAYREGYDNATRSTFSLAARAVARRRGARPTTDGHGIDGPSIDGPSADGPSADGPSIDGPGADVSVSGGRIADGVRAAGLGPTGSSLPAGSPPSEHNPTPLGFPVPPPAPPQLIGEPAAFGGVVYRPFPDPRLVGNSEPLPADRGSLHGVPLPRPSSPRPVSSGPVSAGPVSAGPVSAGPVSAGPASPRPGGIAAASAEGEPASTGRHTVPDELVRSTTYRLPADRVFRAKVPEPTDRPALPDEPTTKLSVPKPRQS